MNKSKEFLLKKAFLDYSGKEAETFDEIVGSGSTRRYYRISADDIKIIGVIGDDRSENKAFFVFTEHFRKYGLNVPKILWKEKKEGVYLLNDLGGVALFDLVMNRVDRNHIEPEIESLYKRSLEELIKFQVVTSKDLDYEVCYPRQKFDQQSMQWDLNYFKYYFLKLKGIPFDEQKLEDDFQVLIKYLSKAGSNFFMYRDFMTRNIMIHNNEPFFIDYQGGRKGPLQYDLASILFQAKADLLPAFRNKMLKYYIQKLKEYISVDEKEFVNHFYGFVLIRTMQVLGAYGYRGYYEKKSHFIESVHYALKNLDWLVGNVEFEVIIPELMKCFKSMLNETKTEQIKKSSSKLTIEINSFSFLKMDIPEDTTGHGGGFVFDCRALPNPGRFEEYKMLSGLDQPVIDFLKDKPEMSQFLDNMFRIIEQSVDTYMFRGFDHLVINFGCTGGQHRSVYSAEKLFERLKSKYNVRIELNHLMKERWNK